MEIKFSNLSPGLATTYGNFIRRAALIQDIGTQVVAIRINNEETASNIFKSIDNVVQDVLEIINNIQDTVWVIDGEYALASATGNTLTSKDFGIKTVDDKVIAECVPNEMVTIEFLLRKANGKQSTQQNQLWSQSIPELGDINFSFITSFHRSLTQATYKVIEHDDLTESCVVTLKTNDGNDESALAHIINSLEQIKTALP